MTMKKRLVFFRSRVCIYSKKYVRFVYSQPNDLFFKLDPIYTLLIPYNHYIPIYYIYI